MQVPFITSFFAGVLLQDFLILGRYFSLVVGGFAFLVIFRSFLGFTARAVKILGIGVFFGLLWRWKFSDFFQLDADFSITFLQNLRTLFLAKINYLFSSSQAAFLAGLLVGERTTMPLDLKLAFNITGLTHIVAISGYNISLVIMLIFKIFMFLPQKPRIFVASIFIILFVFFVGFSPPVVRAAIMGVIALLAMFFNREYLAFQGLFISGFVMVVIDPVILFDSISFQLSFLATLGLLLFADFFKVIFKWLPSRFVIRESVVMTLAAQVLVLPVIIVNFQTLSLISPIANLFVLPLIPMVMLFGFFSVSGGFVADVVGMFFAFFTSLLLGFLLLLVELFAKLPFAQIEIGWFKFGFAVVYYFLILWFLRSRVLNKINPRI